MVPSRTGGGLLVAVDHNAVGSNRVPMREVCEIVDDHRRLSCRCSCHQPAGKQAGSDKDGHGVRRSDGRWPGKDPTGWDIRSGAAGDFRSNRCPLAPRAVPRSLCRRSASRRATHTGGRGGRGVRAVCQRRRSRETKLPLVQFGSVAQTRSTVAEALQTGIGHRHHATHATMHSGAYAERRSWWEVLGPAGGTACIITRQIQIASVFITLGSAVGRVVVAAPQCVAWVTFATVSAAAFRRLPAVFSSSAQFILPGKILHFTRARLAVRTYAAASRLTTNRRAS